MTHLSHIHFSSAPCMINLPMHALPTLSCIHCSSSRVALLISCQACTAHLAMHDADMCVYICIAHIHTNKFHITGMFAHEIRQELLATKHKQLLADLRYVRIGFIVSLRIDSLNISVFHPDSFGGGGEIPPPQKKKFLIPQNSADNNVVFRCKWRYQSSAPPPPKF